MQVISVTYLALETKIEYEMETWQFPGTLSASEDAGISKRNIDLQVINMD